MTTQKLSPTQLKDTVTLALFNLVGEDTTKSVKTDAVVTQVCSILGISEDSWGQVQSQPNKPNWVRFNAIRAIRAIRSDSVASSLGRGKYGLTETGITKAKSLNSNVEEESVSEDTVETPLLVTGSGVSFIPKFDDVVDTYHDDEYITSLGIQSVKCFGFWSSRSASCKTCPLAKSCKKAWIGSLSGIAAELDKRDATPETPVEESVETPAETSAAQSEETDSNEPTGVEITEDNIHALCGEKANIINLPAESACVKCNGMMQAGSKAVWQFGIGTFHTICPSS